MPTHEQRHRSRSTAQMDDISDSMINWGRGMGFRVPKLWLVRLKSHVDRAGKLFVQDLSIRSSRDFLLHRVKGGQHEP